MKKSIKNTLIAISAVLSLAIIGVMLYMWPLLNMKPASTGPVGQTGVVAVQNGRNSVYFIPASDGWIAVDAGTNAAAIERGLAGIGIEPQDVKHVLLTHTDSDHVAALAIFTQADIYMATQELQMTDGTTKRNLLQRNSLPEGTHSRVMPVANGQQLALGGVAVECVLLPGHTPGSMGFFVADAYLFIGDGVAVNSNGRLAVHPFTMDTAQAVESIDTLLWYDCEAIFTAHYGVWERNEVWQ